MKIKGQGNKETIIFLHGIVGNQSAFKREFERLSEEYQVISYDYVGYDEISLGKNVPLSIEVLSKQLENIYDEFNIESANICALSFGSIVASYFTYKNPDKVKSLCYVGGYYNNPSYIKDFFYEISSDFSTPYEQLTKKFADGVNPFLPGVPQSFSEIGREISFDCAMKLHPEVFRSAFGISSLHDSKSDLLNIKQPILWVMGEHDYLYKECIIDLATVVPQAVYKEVANAGHVAHIDNPDAFFSLYEGFLSENNTLVNTLI